MSVESLMTLEVLKACADRDAGLLPQIETADNLLPLYAWDYGVHPTIGGLALSIGGDCDAAPGHWYPIAWGSIAVDSHDIYRSAQPSFLTVPEGIKTIRLETELGVSAGGPGVRAFRIIRRRPSGELSVMFVYGVKEPSAIERSILYAAEIFQVDPGEIFEIQFYHDTPDPIRVNGLSNTIFRMIDKRAQAQHGAYRYGGASGSERT